MRTKTANFRSVRFSTDDLPGPQFFSRVFEAASDKVFYTDVRSAPALKRAEIGVALAPCSVQHVRIRSRRATLAPLVANHYDTGTLRPIPPNNDALQYLSRYIRFLDEQQGFEDSALASTVALHLRDLFAIAIGKREASLVAKGGGLGAARLHAIKRDITENLGHGLTVGAVATRHHVTPRQVQRLFKSEGTSFSEFVLNQRLSRVHRMLADPHCEGWTISAIALDSGFGDVSYFNRRFRRRYGASPSQFRDAMTPTS